MRSKLQLDVFYLSYFHIRLPIVTKHKLGLISFEKFIVHCTCNV